MTTGNLEWDETVKTSEVLLLTGEALGRELPEPIAEMVQQLRSWAESEGPQAQCALFCAFHPPIAEIDARASKAPGFNPTGIEDLDLVRARQTLIRVRDAYLMPTLWDAEKTVLFSHAIRALFEIIEGAIVTGLETDGVGEETG